MNSYSKAFAVFFAIYYLFLSLSIGFEEQSLDRGITSAVALDGSLALGIISLFAVVLGLVLSIWVARVALQAVTGYQISSSSIILYFLSCGVFAGIIFLIFLELIAAAISSALNAGPSFDLVAQYLSSLLATSGSAALSASIMLRVEEKSSK